MEFPERLSPEEALRAIFAHDEGGRTLQELDEDNVSGTNFEVYPESFPEYPRTYKHLAIDGFVEAIQDEDGNIVTVRVQPRLPEYE